jgi:hypothetical protein
MKKIILWGAGGRGIKLLFRLQKDHQEVEYVVDSNLGSTEIVGGGICMVSRYGKIFHS